MLDSSVQEGKRVSGSSRLLRLSRLQYAHTPGAIMIRRRMAGQRMGGQ